jgi:hypothetical protein
MSRRRNIKIISQPLFRHEKHESAGKTLNAELGDYSAITENRNKVIFILVEPATLHLGDILDGDR